MESQIGTGKKSKNFSQQENDLLLDLVMAKRDIFENEKMDKESINEKEMAWKELADEFNENNDYKRDWETLRVNYENMKNVYKKEFSDEKSYIVETGAGEGTESGTVIGARSKRLVFDETMAAMTSKRSKNFTEREIKLLLHLVNEKMHIFNNRKNNYVSIKNKELAWKELADEFNENSHYSRRDWITLKKKYKNLKKISTNNFSDEESNNPETGAKAEVSAFDEAMLGKRNKNFTEHETGLLLDLVNKKMHIFNNKKNDHVSIKSKEMAWEELATTFNENSNYLIRDWKTLKQKYENLKKISKKKFSEEKRYIMRTWTGTATGPKRPAFDESVIGKRSKNFVKHEIKLLLDLVKEKKYIFENKKYDNESIKNRKIAWMKLAHEFNKNSCYLIRDWKTLKQKYENIKKFCKKQLIDENNYISGMKGGPKRFSIADTIEAKRKECVEKEKKRLLLLQKKVVEDQIIFQTEEHEFKIKTLQEEHESKIELLNLQIKNIEEELTHS
ncbi:UNVERIFIED_CONTAM: hypothetical protein RMT77_016018 [Armadillidium vulgare]